MHLALKWTGFAMVALGITVFPFVIWVPGPWGVISLLLVMFGCVVLLAAMVLAKQAASAAPRGASEGSPDD